MWMFAGGGYADIYNDRKSVSDVVVMLVNTVRCERL